MILKFSHKRNYCMVWSETYCMGPSGSCQPSDTRSSGSWLYTFGWIKSGNQKVPETCGVLWHYDRVLALQQVSFVFANSETEICWESCINHFPTTPPSSTRVDVLETGDVPILFSLPQMKNLGTTTEWDPKRDKITCPAFVMYSYPDE